MKKIGAIIPFIGIGIFAAGLSLYAYLGIYNRFWADDWCYNADFVQLGFWGTMKGYTFITHFASNRFSLTFFTLLLQLWGVFSAKITAGLVISLFFCAMYLNILGISRIFKLNWNSKLILLTTTAIVYYTIYLAPNQYRSLFFRSSVLTYTAPLLSFLFVFGILLWELNNDIPSRAILLSIGPLTFIACGFSESGCAYIGTAVGILWLTALFYRNKGQDWAKRIFKPASISLLAAIAALLILILSPAISARHAGYPEPTNPILLPYLSVKFSLDFIIGSFRGLLLPHAMFAMLFFLLPFLEIQRPGTTISLKTSLLSMVIILSGLVLLISAAQIPAIYIEKGPPAAKALISARFFQLFSIAGIFWLAGNFLAAKFKENYRFFALILILVPILYTLRPIFNAAKEVPQYIERAQVWDSRDKSIREAVLQGLEEINVKGIDSAYLGHTLDFKEKATFWTNACAETYYGIDRIQAVLP